MTIRASNNGEPRGQSVVELALILPLLLILMLGVVDLSRAVQAYNIISNMSREGANLAARNTTSIDLQQIMNSLANTAQPLSMSSKGKMYVTVVEGVKGSDSVVVPIIKDKITWMAGSGPDSTVDAATVAKVLSGIEINDKDRFYIFEVYYKYESLFNPNGSFFGYSPQLHSISVF